MEPITPMTEPAEGLPVWRPGTRVRYWLDTREGDGQIGLTQGGPFVTADGTAVVYIAGHDNWLPLARVEWLGPPSTESWWAFNGEGGRR